MYSRNKEWVACQDWQFVKRAFFDSGGTEYSIEINGVEFAVNDVCAFEEELLDIIAKYRV